MGEGKIISDGNPLGFTITAKSLNLTGTSNDNKSQISIFEPATINANVRTQNALIEIGKGTQTQDGQTRTLNGNLNINGNLSTQNTIIRNGVVGGGDRGRLIVNGTSTINSTEFIIYSFDALSNKEAKVLMLTSNGGITLGSGNSASFYIRKDTTLLENTYNFKFLDENSTERGAPLGEGDGVKDNVFETRLKQEGNNLYAIKAVGNKTLKELKIASLDMDIGVIKTATTAQQGQQSPFSQTEIAKLKELQTRLESLKATAQSQTDEQIAQEYNKQYNNQAGDIILSALHSKNQDIKDSAGGIIGNDLLFNNAQGAIQETIDSAGQTTQNSSQNNATNAQNMQTEMATLGRMARFSNPFSSLRFAQNQTNASVIITQDEVKSDVPSFVMPKSDFLNNFWANIFGGANIIGQNVGGLYGINAGYDRAIGAHFVGGYLSYAYATLKDTSVTQNSNNLQGGVYSRLVFGANEVDIKGFIQAGITNQNRYVSAIQNDADFTRAFMGLSASYGYVFKPHKIVYIKPLAGLNLYYNHTPKYDEKGDLAQSVKAINSVNMSLDLGADLRVYWNKDSFFYFTPKFEQYFVSAGNDFVGSFVGSPTTFTIKNNNKLKMYFQGIIGADIGVYKGLAIAISAGVKQIVVGKIQDKNETFASGNLGIKYRF